MAVCVETLYEKDGVNATTMQARQSTQPTHYYHRKQTEYYVNSLPVIKKPSGAATDVNISSRLFLMA